MPGTGKTTTIAHIIQILVKQGKSILLTSYTHTAVDNVLSKVRESGIDVLRIGNPEKVRKRKECGWIREGEAVHIICVNVYCNAGFTCSA